MLTLEYIQATDIKLFRHPSKTAREYIRTAYAHLAASHTGTPGERARALLEARMACGQARALTRDDLDF